MVDALCALQGLVLAGDTVRVATMGDTVVCLIAWVRLTLASHNGCIYLISEVIIQVRMRV
jgi:hypothetical protein